MKLQISIYKEDKKYRWKGFLMTGSCVLEVANDSRFWWAKKQHAKDDAKYTCRRLGWDLEILK